MVNDRAMPLEQFRVNGITLLFHADFQLVPFENPVHGLLDF